MFPLPVGRDTGALALEELERAGRSFYFGFGVSCFFVFMFIF
jgi:hypothetical protein